MAKWWLPDDVAFVDELPHTATGKIAKLVLREQFKDYTLPTVLTYNSRDQHMDFDYSDKVKQLRAKLQSFMNDVVYPNEQTYHDQFEAQDDRWQTPQIIEDMKARRAMPACGTCSCRKATRRRAEQSRIRALVRDHGPLAYRTGSVQLCRPRHRQYGSAGPLRLDEHKEDLAEAAARRQDPLGLCHDRTQGRLVGRHQHRVAIERDGDDYVLNGHKWWISGAGDRAARS